MFWAFSAPLSSRSLWWLLSNIDWFLVIKKTSKQKKPQTPNQTTTNKFYLLFLCPEEGAIASPILIILFPCLSKQPLLFIPHPPILSLHVHLVSLKFCLQHSVSNGI